MTKKKLFSVIPVALFLAMLFLLIPALTARATEPDYKLSEGSCYSRLDGTAILLDTYSIPDGATFADSFGGQSGGLSAEPVYDPDTKTVSYYLTGQAADSGMYTLVCTAYITTEEYEFASLAYKKSFTISVATAQPSEPEPEENPNPSTPDPDAGDGETEPQNPQPSKDPQPQPTVSAQRPHAEISGGGHYTIDSDDYAVLKVDASTEDEGQLHYCWFVSSRADLRNSIDLGDTEEAFSSRYVPPQKEGTYYYYCRVSNVLEDSEAFVYTDAVAVTYEKAPDKQDDELVITPVHRACVPSRQSLCFNGDTYTLEIYNIDGYNYFKLRDIAALMSGTDSQFAVDYDSDALHMLVTPGLPYISVGGELRIGEDRSASCVASRWQLRVDDTYKASYVYNIGGNNFFKLRDLGRALDFDVDYDAEHYTMIVNSRDYLS